MIPSAIPETSERLVDDVYFVHENLNNMLKILVFDYTHSAFKTLETNDTDGPG